MVQVRNLVNEKNGDTVDVPAVIAARSAPPPSGAVALFNQPGFAPALPGDEQLENIGASFGAFVASAHPRNKVWPQLEAAGIKEGDFYIYCDGMYKPLVPRMGYFLVSAELFKTKMDDIGNVVAATRDTSVESDRGSARPWWEEHYVTLIVADLGDRLIPAKADFRGTKSGGVTQAVKFSKFATLPEFATASADHTIAAQFPQPWGRGYHLATVSPRVNKTNGRAYHAANCSSRPATLEQINRLTAALADPGFMLLAEQAMQSYTDRVEMIKAKLPK